MKEKEIKKEADRLFVNSNPIESNYSSLWSNYIRLIPLFVLMIMPMIGFMFLLWEKAESFPDDSSPFIRILISQLPIFFVFGVAVILFHIWATYRRYREIREKRFQMATDLYELESFIRKQNPDLFLKIQNINLLMAYDEILDNLEISDRQML